MRQASSSVVFVYSNERSPMSSSTLARHNLMLNLRFHFSHSGVACLNVVFFLQPHIMLGLTRITPSLLSPPSSPPQDPTGLRERFGCVLLLLLLVEAAGVLVRSGELPLWIVVHSAAMAARRNQAHWRWDYLLEGAGVLGWCKGGGVWVLEVQLVVARVDSVVILVSQHIMWVLS